MPPASVLRKIRSERPSATTRTPYYPGYIDLRTSRHVTKSTLAKISYKTLLAMGAHLNLILTGEKKDYVDTLHNYVSDFSLPLCLYFPHWNNKWSNMHSQLEPEVGGVSEIERLLAKSDYIGRNAFHRFRRHVLRVVCLRYSLLPQCSKPSKDDCEHALWQWVSVNIAKQLFCTEYHKHQRHRLTNSPNVDTTSVLPANAYSTPLLLANDSASPPIPTNSCVTLPFTADSHTTRLFPRRQNQEEPIVICTYGCCEGHWY